MSNGHLFLRRARYGGLAIAGIRKNIRILDDA